MKNILVTCVLGLCLMCSAFATTSAFAKNTWVCDASVECAASDNKGCKVKNCEFMSSGSELLVICNYESCRGGEVSPEETVN